MIIIFSFFLSFLQTWEYPTPAIGPYAQSKQEAEKQILAKASELKEEQTKIMIIRPRLIWGPGESSRTRKKEKKKKRKKEKKKRGGEKKKKKKNHFVNKNSPLPSPQETPLPSL